VSQTLLIDCNSIGYAAQGTTKLHSGGIETQAAYGFLRTLRTIRQKYPRHTLMALSDETATWRYALHPEYKGNRKSDDKKVAEREAYAAMRPYIKKALNTLGVRQLTADNYEADDLAGYLVGKLSADPANQVGLISGDQDWMQLVRRNVFWRDMRDDSKLVTANNFYDKTGCLTPFAFLECKILTGDTSDCISGVGGIGEKGAPEFIAEFGGVRNFWKLCESGKFEPKKKAHINLATGPGRALYKRNFQLMQLLKVEAPAKSDTKLDLGKFDKEAFATICSELAFTSILRNLDEFVANFQ